MVPRHRAIGQVIHRRGPWRNFEAVEFATLVRCFCGAQQGRRGPHPSQMGEPDP